MLADESEFETKFDSAVEDLEHRKKTAAEKLTTAIKFLSLAENYLIEAAGQLDTKATVIDFDAVIRLEVKLEDIGCDLRSQLERMK